MSIKSTKLRIYTLLNFLLTNLHVGAFAALEADVDECAVLLDGLADVLFSVVSAPPVSPIVLQRHEIVPDDGKFISVSHWRVEGKVRKLDWYIVYICEPEKMCSCYVITDLQFYREETFRIPFTHKKFPRLFRNVKKDRKKFHISFCYIDLALRRKFFLVSAKLKMC